MIIISVIDVVMGIRIVYFLWWVLYDCCYSFGKIGLFVLMLCKVSYKIEISIFLIVFYIFKLIIFLFF